MGQALALFLRKINGKAKTAAYIFNLCAQFLYTLS
jgi:hypothetical protein